jgi:hypothetical protein
LQFRPPKRKSPPRFARRTYNESQEAYFAGAGCDAGLGGVFAGAAGWELVVEPFTPDNTEPDPCVPLRRTAKIDNVIEVTMNNTADQVVAFESAVAAPRGPKAVWLPIPPNAAAISPLFPLCSSTTTIRKKHTKMCTV